MKCYIHIIHLKNQCRLIVSNDKLQKLIQVCQENKLFISIQDYKVKSIVDKGKNGFSNKNKIVPYNDLEGDLIVYISKTKKDCSLAKEFDKNNDNKNLGKILGYPDCCINFYLKNLRNQSRKQLDFIIPTKNKVFEYPFVNNYLLRYFDIIIINHFPCSFHCEKTKKLGNSYLNIIKKYDLKVAKHYERMLKSFVLYTEYDGVFFSPDYQFKNKIIHYKVNINGTIDNWIFTLLGNNNKIECIRNNKFRIGNKLFENEGIIAIFK